MTTLDTNGANAMRAPTDAEIFLYAHRGAVEWPAEHIKNMDMTMLAREVERLRALSSIPEQGVEVKPVSIKPLEWIEPIGADFCRATTPFGDYLIYPDGEPRFHGPVRWRLDCFKSETSAATKVGAKRAAEADYQSRTACMIAPSHPAAVAVTDEMVERAWAEVTAFDFDRDGMRRALEAALRSTP